MIKPSLWFIPLSCLTFIIAMSILIVLFAMNRDRLEYHSYAYIEAFVFLLAGRLMFATLQWFGHLYILSDYRIMRISGIFSTEIFDCPLRKVAGAELIYTVKERLLGLGSIAITPANGGANGERMRARRISLANGTKTRRSPPARTVRHRPRTAGGVTSIVPNITHWPGNGHDANTHHGAQMKSNTGASSSPAAAGRPTFRALPHRVRKRKETAQRLSRTRDRSASEVL